MNGYDTPECAHLTELERKLIGMWLQIPPASIIGPPTGTLVGEMPGRSSSSKLPLFPHPKNSSGGRLLKLSGLTPGQYLGRLARVNLFSEFAEGWDEELATKQAEKLRVIFPPKHKVVLCGVKVGKAFGCMRFFEQFHDKDAMVTYMVIPHPSGRNAIYTDAVARVGAKATIQFAANILTEAQVKDAVKKGSIK